MKAYKRKERSVLSFRSNFVVDIYSLYIYIYIYIYRVSGRRSNFQWKSGGEGDLIFLKIKM